MDITIDKKIEHVCKTIYDPEIPQNIWDLGLIVWVLIGIGMLGVCYLLFMELRDL